jgi:hypothetical protein
MRYVAGGALALGIAAGVWLGDWFKGFGPGGGEGSGLRRSGEGVQTSVASGNGAELGVTAASLDRIPPVTTLRVVIRDRSYFLRDGATDTPVELSALVEAAQRQPPDDDGIKLRLYRTNTARVTAELQLKDALHAAGIADAAIYTAKDAVE